MFKKNVIKMNRICATEKADAEQISSFDQLPPEISEMMLCHLEWHDLQ